MSSNSSFYIDGNNGLTGTVTSNDNTNPPTGNTKAPSSFFTDGNNRLAGTVTSNDATNPPTGNTTAPSSFFTDGNNRLTGTVVSNDHVLPPTGNVSAPASFYTGGPGSQYVTLQNADTLTAEFDADLAAAQLAAVNAQTSANAAAAAAASVPSFGSALPLMDGTATAGTANFAVRQDHVHPTDTSRAPAATQGLPAACNFNTVVANGIYETNDALSTNIPSFSGQDQWFLLRVEAFAPTYTRQVAYGVNTGRTFTRLQEAGTWFAWHEFAYLDSPAFTGAVSGNGSATFAGYGYFGPGGTGAGVGQVFIDGGSGAGGGPYIELRKNGAVKWQIGTLSVSNSTTSDDLYIYDADAGVNPLTISAANGAIYYNVALHYGTVFQYNAVASFRNGVGAGIEFGHTNTAGYGSAIGAETGTGYPYVAFTCGPGTTGNTYKTLGLAGSVFKGDGTGGFTWQTVSTVNADNQTPTTTMALSSTGVLSLGGRPFMFPNTAAYNSFYDAAGNIALYLGGSDPGNYYRNSTHYFQSIGGGATFLSINSVQAQFSVPPLGPTPANGTNTTQLATTAYVQSNSGSSGGACCGRLVYSSATLLTFVPYNGADIKINGAIVQIPAAGITAANTSVYVNGSVGNLAASTLYYVYLWNNAGTLTFLFDTATHQTSTLAGNVGVEIGGAAFGAANSAAANQYTLIGMVRTNVSSQFVDSTSSRYVASWFNRKARFQQGASWSAATTTSTTPVELGGGAYRIDGVYWGDEVTTCHLQMESSTSVAAGVPYSGIGMDATGFLGENFVTNPTAGYFSMQEPTHPFSTTEGYHYFTVTVETSGGTATYYGTLYGQSRG